MTQVTLRRATPRAAEPRTNQTAQRLAQGVADTAQEFGLGLGGALRRVPCRRKAGIGLFELRGACLADEWF